LDNTNKSMGFVAVSIKVRGDMRTMFRICLFSWKHVEVFDGRHNVCEANIDWMTKR